MHKTAIIAEAQENVAKVQENILEEDIEKMVEGEEDEESYASEFADSVFQDDDDDSGNRIEPGSHKKNPEVVDYDDVDDNVDKEKNNDDVEEKKYNKNDDNNDHGDHTLIRGEVSGSLETRNENMQTPIPSPPRFFRTDLSSDKTLSEELTKNVLPTPETTSKDPNMSQPTFSKHKILPGSVAELSRRSGQLREQLTDTFITKEYFEAIPRMVNDAVKKDREIFADVVPKMVLKEFSTHAPKIIEELFKRHMENKVLNVHPTAQAADPEMQDFLKKKFEKSSASASSGKVHDAHQRK
ncbi:hypothetical protein Tco_1030732 [Tanacetum coccineum]|uniref:Uncharacterized protein n=1 Tax=Tanacetum coccineum TaxID=301880 RepID=A0ABQ5G719_9ASTR